MKYTAKHHEHKLKFTHFLGLAIAGFINAFGITVFLAPVKLYDSGISGTSMLLSQVTPLPLSVYLLILNIPLFLYGLKKQGRNFTIYSLFAVCMYSLGAYLITDVIPIDVTLSSPLAGKDLLLCSLFGGLISGVGSGLTIRLGGAIDGVEVMSVIFAKRLGVTVGTFVMVYNVILYIISGIVLGSWILPLYSIVTYGAGLKTIDFIVEGLDRSKAMMIITEKADEICDALSEEYECGVTQLMAKGHYSKQAKTAVYFIVNRFQIPNVKEIAHDIDPEAFMTITEVADVYTSIKQ
ncbi:MAG: YitT family protein [Ruminococcaceae bacterium]|nr:YitT family protein [Oscillospiraceae bacterium]